MKYDATLKKMFRRPPNKLLSKALGKDVVVARTLPTDLITVENLHPDLLFESTGGELIHAELHGYGMDDFACRNLIYFGLLLRDYGKPPEQVVFWIGKEKVGVTAGLTFAGKLDYEYQVIDVKEIAAELLLEGAEIEEIIFAVLCKYDDQRETVRKILQRIGQLPVAGQREAVAQLLVLSGLRGLKSLVKEEIARMPFTIDIHENEFLEEVYQDGVEKGLEKGLEKGRLESARELVTGLAEAKFGTLPEASREKIQTAGLADLQRWSRRVLHSSVLEEVFR